MKDSDYFVFYIWVNQIAPSLRKVDIFFFFIVIYHSNAIQHYIKWPRKVDAVNCRTESAFKRVNVIVVQGITTQFNAFDGLL